MKRVNYLKNGQEYWVNNIGAKLYIAKKGK
jgi:hypothetical protein